MAVIQIPQNVKELIIPRIQMADITKKSVEDFLSGVAAVLKISGKFEFDRKEFVFITEEKTDEPKNNS